MGGEGKTGAAWAGEGVAQRGGADDEEGRKVKRLPVCQSASAVPVPVPGAREGQPRVRRSGRLRPKKRGTGIKAGTTGKWNGLTGEEGRCSADSRVRNPCGRGGEDGHATMMVVINVVINDLREGRNCGGPFLEFVVCCCYNGKWYPG